MCSPKVYLVSNFEWAFIVGSLQRFTAGRILFLIRLPYPETWDKQVLHQRVGRVEPKVGKVFASCIPDEAQEVEEAGRGKLQREMIGEASLFRSYRNSCASVWRDPRIKCNFCALVRWVNWRTLGPNSP